ncbi:hypothetical protein [Bacillus sp. FJAT-22090]|uniref:hypothetical protein n=1 Tax=Bacillus sp. FJAT-22090 TaxID=1581038 RepID=UPI0011AAC25C|nr:hypothetical protein [Bacillus sp. FJAT-22090]
MAKAGARNLQEHQILLQMSIRLKELANKYNVFLTTSTQLNNNIKEEGNMDDSSLSGAKSIAQKVDIGAIMIPINKQDEAIIETIMSNNSGSKESFGLMPTHSINFYKNRGNPWKNVRIFIHFNMDNLQVTDLFVTDYKGNLIPNIKPLDVKFDDIEKDEIEELAKVEESVEEYDELPESFDEETKEELPNAFKSQSSGYSF